MSLSNTADQMTIKSRGIPDVLISEIISYIPRECKSMFINFTDRLPENRYLTFDILAGLTAKNYKLFKETIKNDEIQSKFDYNKYVLLELSKIDNVPLCKFLLRGSMEGILKKGDLGYLHRILTPLLYRKNKKMINTFLNHMRDLEIHSHFRHTDVSMFSDIAIKCMCKKGKIGGKGLLVKSSMIQCKLQSIMKSNRKELLKWVVNKFNYERSVVLWIGHKFLNAVQFGDDNDDVLEWLVYRFQIKKEEVMDIDYPLTRTSINRLVELLGLQYHDSFKLLLKIKEREKGRKMVRDFNLGYEPPW